MPNAFFDHEVLDRCILQDGDMPCECWNPDTPVTGDVMDLSKCLECGTILVTKPNTE